MGTINSALSLTTGALDADQAALSVVANNVANANTTGYTEETPNWQENSPIEVGGISVGDGVTETGATSQRDRVLEERLDQQQQLASASSTRLTALDNIQALFTPDSGSSSSTAGDIGSDITSFFDSFSSLESDPTDNALREQVLSSASTLAGDISSAASSLNSQSAALDQEASGVVSQVNSLTSSIAQLNLANPVHFAGCRCRNAGGPAATGPEPAFATDRDQPGDDGEQRALDHDDFGAVAGFRRAELPVDHGNGERSHGLFSGRNRYHFAIGDRRRATGRVPDGAGHGHSQRAQLARSTGVQHLDRVSMRRTMREPIWTESRAREPTAAVCREGLSALHLQRAHAGGRQRGQHERGDDRSQPDCRGWIWRWDGR